MYKHLRLLLTAPFLLLTLCAHAQQRASDYMPPMTDEEREAPHVMAQSYGFEQDFLDSQWQGIIAASDGKTYFGVSSHAPRHNGQFYSFDPETNAITHIEDLGAWVGEAESVGRANTQGKIHSNIYEVDGRLYMTTTSGDFSEAMPYRGGHFIAYDLETGETIDLAHYPDVNGGGLLTMMYEPVYERLYAIHQRDQTLVYYDLKTGDVVTVGSIEDNAHQCRDLISDERGNVYGSTWDGLIFKYDPATEQRSVLLTRVPHDPDAAQPPFDGEKAWTHWAQVRWDPVTQWWYGVRRNDEYLFRFRPPTDPTSHRGDAEGLAQIGVKPSAVDQPRIGTLALAIQDRTLYYVSIDRDWKDGYADVGPDILYSPTGAHLMSYDLDTGEVLDHGPIFTDGGRRVAEIHSLVAGSDGKLHAVAMVWSLEGVDPSNEWPMAKRRGRYMHPRFVTIDADGL